MVPLLLALLVLILAQGASVPPLVLDDEHAGFKNASQYLRPVVKGQGAFRHLSAAKPSFSADLYDTVPCRFRDTDSGVPGPFRQPDVPPAAPVAAVPARAPPA
ncbi:hypothetical protein [Trichlorobacter ammonificans]|uniref:Uncharacterized protein n=1 Tax=Trichlorobacter ammonificans TaxID=2916410 RepID=A0ABM9D8K0_9BACT|nr:hypothetical protein [Trichlorobacter ammonificans]CAH2030709.1 exported protein of unknown function [Trichlorobacter ammonificans]